MDELVAYNCDPNTEYNEVASLFLSDADTAIRQVRLGQDMVGTTGYPRACLLKPWLLLHTTGGFGPHETVT